MKVRRVNDILMQTERSFLDSQGMPYRKEWKHVILAPSPLDSYEGSSFAGLYHLLWEFKHNKKTKDPLNQIREHLSVIVFHINSAKILLKQKFC